MKKTNKIPNNLTNETSPYLIQHAYNPVNWYPWKKEVFEKAKLEDKPIFLSIGYSTCHWCHVMERESFEDNEVATLLNKSFICIKVDKEERPDIDSIYMTACQTFTGSGGWPLTAIITYDQKPFFVGTYFPKKPQYGVIGLMDLLENITYQWKNNRSNLLKSSEEATRILLNHENKEIKDSQSTSLSTSAINKLKRIFDNEYGGFGSAPKFPTPHNLLFLLKHYEITNDSEALIIIEKTLLQMYKGGIFDHIGFGFSRYSTDRTWLVPHFEKMLYDNALLTIAYLEVYDITKKEIYKSIAEKTMNYISRELTNSNGGFYCAEDADSDGIEGKHYVFNPKEIIDILGQENGNYFNQYFDITDKGNFEGQNIPNLINKSYFDEKIENFLPQVLEYRKNRTTLHKDDKILTSWNSLMIIAFVKAFKILKNDFYLEKALKANEFIINHLSNGNKLYTSTRNGKHSQDGYLDDYAFYISAQLELYQVTLEQNFLDKANALTNIVINDFYDHLNGGFYLYGNDSERLILRPKETYDGAIPSGNSFMTYNLIQLTRFFESVKLDSILKKQSNFMTQRASSYPLGNSFYLLCELIIKQNFKKITCVLKNKSDLKNILFPQNSYIIILETPTQEYPLKNNKTTFYICEKDKCLHPTNHLN